MIDKIDQHLHDAMVTMRDEHHMSVHQIAQTLGLSWDTVRRDLSGVRKAPYKKRKDEAISILRAALARLEAA